MNHVKPCLAAYSSTGKVILVMQIAIMIDQWENEGTKFSGHDQTMNIKHSGVTRGVLGGRSNFSLGKFFSGEIFCKIVEFFTKSGDFFVKYLFGHYNDQLKFGGNFDARPPRIES